MSCFGWYFHLQLIKQWVHLPSERITSGKSAQAKCVMMNSITMHLASPSHIFLLATGRTVPNFLKMVFYHRYCHCCFYIHVLLCLKFCHWCCCCCCWCIIAIVISIIIIFTIVIAIVSSSWLLLSLLPMILSLLLFNGIMFIFIVVVSSSSSFSSL